MKYEATRDWQDEAAERHETLTQGKRFKLNVGENSVRILPGVRADGTLGGKPWHEGQLHRSVGPNNRMETCGKDKNGKGACWLCDTQIPKLRVSPKKASRVAAKKMKAVPKINVQVAWMSNGKWRGPKLWAVPTGGDKALFTLLLGHLKKTHRDYVSPTTGYNFNIDRTGTGFTDTRYSVPVPDDEPSVVPEDILEKMKPLNDLVPPYDEDRMIASYWGRDVDDEDDKAENEAPEPEEPEDDPEEDAKYESGEFAGTFDEPEDEPEEKPKKAKKGKKKKGKKS